MPCGSTEVLVTSIMESRTKKSRSLAIDEKSPTSKRPGLGDRHNSAPPVKPRRESQSKRVSTSTKASEQSKRSSKISQKDEVKPRPTSQRPLGSTRPESHTTLATVRPHISTRAHTEPV